MTTGADLSGIKWELHRYMVTPEFSAILSADPVLDELDRRKCDPHQELLQIQAVMDPASCRIELEDLGRYFPCQFLTPAMWARLYTFGCGYCTGANFVGEDDTDLFFFAVSRGFGALTSDAPENARGFCARSGVSWERMVPECHALIKQAFFPMSYLPINSVREEDHPRYNARWILQVCSRAARMTATPIKSIFADWALSEVLFYNVIHTGERLPQGGLIEPTPDEICRLQMERTYELGREGFRAKFGRDPEPDPDQKKEE